MQYSTLEIIIWVVLKINEGSLYLFCLKEDCKSNSRCSDSDYVNYLFENEPNALVKII